MRLPEWIRTKSFTGLHETKQILRSHGLSTVCEEARCPNIGMCFSKPTATFLIMGPYCTRHCSFCSVKPMPGHSANPSCNDEHALADEHKRIAAAARRMKLKYVVITSVTRDDLPDGGASHFVNTVNEVRGSLPHAGIEILTPDFRGEPGPLKAVLGSCPDVFNHNVETVPRLYRLVRPQADYVRSLNVLRKAREIAPDIPRKSGLMVGLGETFDEVISVMRDLNKAGCNYLTIGQYLRPSKENLPVVEYITPDTFERYRLAALNMGFKAVASAPLARSSMNAEGMFKGELLNKAKV